MSWAEVFKINKNMKRALNEQIQDLQYQEMKIITANGTYKPEKTGLYKVICVGAGGDGYLWTKLSSQLTISSGGGGGVAIKTLHLSANTNYTVTVGTTASFVYDTNTILTATAGSNGNANTGGEGGVASGGDKNYTGTSGVAIGQTSSVPSPGGVGVCLSGMSPKPAPAIATVAMYVSGSTSVPNHTRVISLDYGNSILGYGGGGTGVAGNIFTILTGAKNEGDYFKTNGRPASIIIVPLEMEE